MSDLPPELSRLGDELTAAVARSAAVRRRRRTRVLARLLVTAVIGAIAFAALTPEVLSPGDERPLLDFGSAIAAAQAKPAPCDQPSGVRFRAACLRYGPGADRPADMR